MPFHYLINWNVQILCSPTIHPKTILASVRFNILCHVVFHELNIRIGWLRIGPADPLSQRLKTTLIANQSDAPLPSGVGQPSISATTTDISRNVISPSLHLILSFSFLNSLCFFYPGRRRKLRPLSETKDITLCHIIFFSWREVRMFLLPVCLLQTCSWCPLAMWLL